MYEESQKQPVIEDYEAKQKKQFQTSWKKNWFRSAYGTKLGAMEPLIKFKNKLKKIIVLQ